MNQEIFNSIGDSDEVKVCAVYEDDPQYNINNAVPFIRNYSFSVEPNKGSSFSLLYAFDSGDKLKEPVEDLEKRQNEFNILLEVLESKGLHSNKSTETKFCSGEISTITFGK